MLTETWMKHLSKSLLLFFGIISFFAILLFAGGIASAEVVRLQIDSREEIQGQVFNPAVGSYEKITGLFYLEVDPDDSVNARITDLQLAPLNARGRVEFTTEFELYQPINPGRGNGRLFYFVNNRGNRHGAGFFSAELEYNWLWDQGFSYLWCGWACDVIESNRKLNIRVPAATRDGQPIVGRVYAEMISYSNSDVPSLPLTWGGSIARPAVSLDNTGAVLTRHRYSDDERETIPNDAWSFAQVENGEIIPDSGHIHVYDGIQPGWLYELVYTSQNPPLTGLGMAAIRDVVSFFRYEVTDEATQPNPLAGHVEYAYSWGHSQSGRLLNHFVWQGFNSDEAGRKVFDGVMPNCPGAGKGQFNSRFAQTTRHGSHLEDNLYPVDFFPFAFEEQTDPVTGETGDALELAREQGNVPKMMIINSATDYWTRAASLLHTDVEGMRDADIDLSVRIYSVAGIAHTEGRLAVVGRALLVALDEWVSQGIAPPVSRVPRIDNGTLVNLESVRERFPTVPGLRLPDSYYHPYRLDPGRRWKTEGIADHVPPLTGPRYVCLVPQVDADGNEIAGVRLPEIEVPLATFCGWKLRRPGFSNSLSRNNGRVLPLAIDTATREAGGDGRLSIAERYATPEDYLSRAKTSLAQLLADRLILPIDHDRMQALAEKQAKLVGKLRSIEQVAVGESTEAAQTYFEQLREADLEWYYGPRGSVGVSINEKGYALMSDGRLELSEKVFLLNTRLYPDNSNVWDSLAECLFKQKRYDKSREYYEKTLDLNPANKGASKMLDRIAEAQKH
ncbi:MAG: tetratricopeptide repeat protein [Gemmatimonadales bacterium]|nr:tetratricopeptide repeat protein [Gemmatimonadales bacterium]